MFGKGFGFLIMDQQHQMCSLAIEGEIQLSRSRQKEQKSSEEEKNAGDNEEEEDYDEKEEINKDDEGKEETLVHDGDQGSEKEKQHDKSFENKENNKLATEIIEVQNSSDEEEVEEEEEEQDDYDEKKDDTMEKQNTTKENIDQICEEEGQNNKSCEREGKSNMLTEIVEKKRVIPQEDSTKQEEANAKVCTVNSSELAVADSLDRTSGRLLNKFSLFKRKSSRQKNEHTCDENKLETLPQNESKHGNQADVSDEKSKDENQNHTSTNRRELQRANQKRKASSTCIVL